MENWINLSKERKQEIFRQTSEKLNLTAESVEKDFMVVVVLRAVFSLPISDHLVFKGGTSLSKCWSFLSRFSEDIDITMNRELIGFGGNLSKTQIKKMRKHACEFVSTTIKDMLQKKLNEMGFSTDEFTIEAEKTQDGTTDRDPQKIFFNYNSIVDKTGYLKDRVVIEIGSRSQLEPSERRSLNSLVSEAFPNGRFIQAPLELTVVSPARTFLEKMILLHEELQKPTNEIRHERMSRHLYDLERLMDTQYGTEAISNDVLFREIINHRSMYTPIKGVDYNTLEMDQLKFIPFSEVLHLWEADYKIMQDIMIYGESLNFNELIVRLNELVNRLKHNK